MRPLTPHLQPHFIAWRPLCATPSMAMAGAQLAVPGPPFSGEKIGNSEREEDRERGKTGGNKLDVPRLTVWANAHRLGRSRARAAL